MTAMLKSHHVHLTVLSRSLEEDITPKKTWERLNRNLSKEGLGAELMRMNLRKNARKIKDFRYCIIDGGDIQKPEAKQMEGLGRVRDGSKKTKDKKPVMGPMITKDRRFVIRGQSTRSLRLHKDSNKATNIKKIEQRTKTPYT